MGLFKIFKKDKKENSLPKGFNLLTIAKITRLTEESVMVTLDIPAELKADYTFIPGQYIDFSVNTDGKDHRRSYSICSGPGEAVSIAVKAMPNGTVSKWFNEVAHEGMEIACSKPQGQFTLEPGMKKVVAFAAGSGITPILSMAKGLEAGAEMHLYYGNRNQASAIFLNEVNNLPNVKVQHYFSQETVEGAKEGRLDDSHISDIIKENLDLLKSDAFFMCGPIEMTETITKKLKLFGVADNKIKRELFSAPVADESPTDTSVEPVASDVTVLLDGEEIDVKFKPKGKTILELLDAEGYDPPYSCRGGVCSTCKAKVTEGKATMRMNYVLTDQEVEEGYVLCCQTEPLTDKIRIEFDV